MKNIIAIIQNMDKLKLKKKMVSDRHVLCFITQLVPLSFIWIGKGYWEQIMGHTDYIELTVDFE